MAYEQTYFGDGSPAGSGNVVKVVHNHFGQRASGDTNGVTRTAGFQKELTVDLTGTLVGEGFPLEAPFIPAGSKIIKVYFQVKEAFALGGTDPVIEIGTEGSEATNGVTITEAQAEAVGTYDITSALSGTWADDLTAKTLVGIVLDGTSPTVTEAGKARLVVEYIKT